MDTSARSIFRIALAAYVVSTGCFVVKLLIIGPGALPDPAIAYLTWWLQQPLSEWDVVLTWIGNVAAAGSIVAAFGMFAFARWARPVFVASIAVLQGGELVSDLPPVLYTAVNHFLASLLGIFAGAIIVFAYWSNVYEAFDRRAT
jgi:hypothetical protein